MYRVSCPWRQFSAPVQLITGTLSTLSSSPVWGEKTYGFQTIKPPSAGTSAGAWRGYSYRSFCPSGHTPTLRPSGSHGRNSLIVKFDRCHNCHDLFCCRLHIQYEGSTNYAEIYEPPTIARRYKCDTKFNTEKKSIPVQDLRVPWSSGSLYPREIFLYSLL